MKTTIPLVAALVCGLSPLASAFSLNFANNVGATLPPNPLTIAVPGYGSVSFQAAIGSNLAVNNVNSPFIPSVAFDTGEAVQITFNGLAPTAVSFDFVGVGVNEGFTVSPFSSNQFVLSLGGAGEAQVSLASTSAQCPNRPLPFSAHSVAHSG